MTLSRDQVRHVAHLARLGLEPGEEEFYAEQLSKILGHIERMSALDTESISPTAQVVEIVAMMRDDVARPSLPPEVAVANAPETQDGFIVVKSIQEAEPA
jgi:aspartyl-tRNA(Asn)/glutamyl-tRNA(Gln) amidotransferase subunit C